MHSGRISYKYLIVLGLLLFHSGCSVEKNTATTRFYHGFTAKYNIYFNAHESFRKGVQKISNTYTDDFSELLRVFENSDRSTVSLVSSDMDIAIQKASKLISLKSITARPEIDSRKDLTENEKALLEMKEFNEWVDDSYFLIGKARFYKHEFSEAESVFNHCITEANDPLIRIESAIWLARINCERDDYSEAARLLRETVPEPGSPKALMAFYQMTLADMFIRQKRYGEAIEPLNDALGLTSGKRSKYRLTYLLAQLYERTGDSQGAISNYRKVVKMNPPYEVEFNARINIAGVFDVNSGDPAEILKELEKMLKDSKNYDFRDQIYFAIGNLMKKEGREEEALEYYRKSAAAVSGNRNQKSRSYLALAEHWYAIPDYIRAGIYYDSTVYFLEESYPDYKSLQTKSQNLNALVTHLKVIQTEDSLQKVASMSESERTALIAGIIAEITKAENEGRTSEYSDRAAIGQYYENARRFQDNIEQEGKWYFYNQTALSFGRSEFRRRWGDRKLEDNWRRSNKARVTTHQVAGLAEEDGRAQSDTAGAVVDYKKPEFYLRNLPLNDSLLRISDEKIASALFNAGRVFEERIADRQKAAESYESLLTRYPSNALVPEVLYSLYNLYRDNNAARAEVARQRLLEKYPESEFARILSDPDYFNKKMAQIRKSEELYQKAFDLYKAEDFTSSISLCDSALAENPSGSLSPKFMLLRAYSIARISDERTFKDELNRLIKTWPETEEAKRATELSAHLNQKMPELKIEEDKAIASEIFVADTTAPYSFMVIIMDRGFNINQASFDVISHNIDNYTDRNYKTEGLLVNNSYIRITVSGFSDNRAAWKYFNSFDPGNIIRNSSGARIMTFLINEANRRALEEDKNPERYFLFFNENYRKGQKI
ncbi:MAG TPA: tetratricopeptide repeat protein [Bacteroidales bacterium]|nr:tetratricopeptide repeat protein [Bacteroidales bacterium]